MSSNVSAIAGSIGYDRDPTITKRFTGCSACCVATGTALEAITSLCVAAPNVRTAALASSSDLPLRSNSNEPSTGIRPHRIAVTLRSRSRKGPSIGRSRCGCHCARGAGCGANIAAPPTCMLRQPDRERDRLFSILDAHTGARFYRVPGLFNWLQDDAGRNALALLSRVLWFSISEEVMEAECAALARGGEDGVLIVAHVIADTHVFIGSLAELARAKDKLYKSRADLPRQNQRYYQLKGAPWVGSGGRFRIDQYAMARERWRRAGF